VPLDEVREVVEVSKKGKDTEFQLVLDAEVCLSLSCASGEDRSLWVAEIRRCIDLGTAQSAKSFSQ
jgi:hypothetical protein